MAGSKVLSATVYLQVGKGFAISFALHQVSFSFFKHVLCVSDCVNPDR